LMHRRTYNNGMEGGGAWEGSADSLKLSEKGEVRGEAGLLSLVNLKCRG